MPRSDHPTYNRTTVRTALHHVNVAVASLTNALDGLYRSLDEDNVLTLDFGTTSVVEAIEAAEAAEAATANGRKPMVIPSRADYPKQRAPWTYDEEQAIRSALLLGFGQAWIGQHLGRTTKAVHEHIREMRKEGRL